MKLESLMWLLNENRTAIVIENNKEIARYDGKVDEEGIYYVDGKIGA